MQNRPQGRKTNVTGVGKPIGKTGSGLGTGPVGHGNGYSGRPSGSQPSGNNGHRSSGGGGSLLIKLCACVAFAAAMISSSVALRP